MKASLLLKHIQQQMLFSLLDYNYALIVVLPMHSFLGWIMRGVLAVYLLQQVHTR